MIQNLQIIETSTNSKIVFSNLNQYFNTDKDTDISLKIVLEGEEHYSINNRQYTIKDNNYIIVNKGEEVAINVDSKKQTKGLCIYPPMDLINEAFSSQLIGMDKYLSNLDNHLKEVTFTTLQYNMNHTKLGTYLNTRVHKIINYKEEVDFLEFYCDLTEIMVCDQLQIEEKLQLLSATKRQTREELYRRMSIAIAYMHDNKYQKINLEELCKSSYLSKYHFIRCFKELFQQSPYQYLLSLKLAKAKELYSKGYSYREITELTGFSDVKNLKKKLKLY